jgi:hypothetical protein
MYINKIKKVASKRESNMHDAMGNVDKGNFWPKKLD